ncbi:uncharacterized protein [Amphiura filiformis]|uniref:uncharacterized protein n=1 Tax=Amphiura filiformis TaxID=82378 RepID=UPI003B213D88
MSPKIFTTAMEDIFRKLNLQERGINIDGEKLTDLRFADDVALVTTSVKDMEVQLNDLNKGSKKIGLKIHKGKTKYMTNHHNMKTKVTITIPIDDAYTSKVVLFSTLSITFVGIFFYCKYIPDLRQRDWSRREALRVMAEKEAAGETLLINPDFIPLDMLIVPTDEEMDAVENRKK